MLSNVCWDSVLPNRNLTKRPLLWGVSFTQYVLLGILTNFMTDDFKLTSLCWASDLHLLHLLESVWCTEPASDRQLKKPVLSIFLLEPAFTVLGFHLYPYCSSWTKIQFPNPVHQIYSTFSPDYFLRASHLPQTLFPQTEALLISPLEYWYPTSRCNSSPPAKISIRSRLPWAFIWHGTSFAEFTKPLISGSSVLLSPNCWHALCFVCVCCSIMCNSWQLHGL